MEGYLISRQLLNVALGYVVCHCAVDVRPHYNDQVTI